MAKEAGLLGEHLGDVALGRREAEIRRERHPQPRQIDAPAAERNRSALRTVRPWTVVASGSRASSLAIAESSSAISATVRAIGPATGSDDQPSSRFSLATSPGRRAETDDAAERGRIAQAPPVSEPDASATMPVASATAEPPDDPAADLRGSNGLPVAPYTAFRVLAPAPNSGVLVLPAMMPPAARIACTTRSSLSGTFPAKIGLPKVVGSPAASWRSLIPTGRPASGPGASPAITALSTCAAAARAPGKSVATIAFTAWFTRSMRRMQLSRSALAESSFRPIRARASSAVRSQGSPMAQYPSAKPSLRGSDPPQSTPRARSIQIACPPPCGRSTTTGSWPRRASASTVAAGTPRSISSLP